jgi:hypothetical protein
MIEDLLREGMIRALPVDPHRVEETPPSLSIPQFQPLNRHITP